MNDFYLTLMGKRFYEGTMPALNKNIATLCDAVGELTKKVDQISTTPSPEEIAYEIMLQIVSVLGPAPSSGSSRTIEISFDDYNRIEDAILFKLKKLI